MRVPIINTLSPTMLPRLDRFVRFSPLSLEGVQDLAVKYGLKSYVHNYLIAQLLWRELGSEVLRSSDSLLLELNKPVILGQYRGPGLNVQASIMPARDAYRIEWWSIMLADPLDLDNDGPDWRLFDDRSQP